MRNDRRVKRVNVSEQRVERFNDQCNRKSEKDQCVGTDGDSDGR